MPYICNVKRVCIFLLVPVFLLNGSLGEALKLPALVSHFFEHRQQDPSVDLGDFLSMHYWGDDHNAGDQDRDMQLPYKKIIDTNTHEIAPLPASALIFERLVHVVGRTAPLVMRECNLSDPSLGSPFRPPCC